jgi:hypothetical protein
MHFPGYFCCSKVISLNGRFLQMTLRIDQIRVIATKNWKSWPILSVPFYWKVTSAKIVLYMLKLRAKSEDEVSNGTLGGNRFIRKIQLIK